MMSILALLLLACGALGTGSIILQLSGVRAILSFREDVAISLTLGTGMIGWLAFFPGVVGYYTQPALLLVALLPCAGLIPLWLRYRSAGCEMPCTPYSFIEKLLVFGLIIALAFDVFEAVSPQADADTMAYHFATPALFLQHGTIEFIPRAIDGGVPLLQQMGYGVALSLGGELTANLWLMLSGWTVGLMTYVTMSRLGTRTWGLVCTLIVMTTPAIVYGAGTGQVEVRSAAYVIVAALTVYLAIKEDNVGFALVAAVAAGLFFGTKYTGLLIGFSCGVVFLLQGRKGIKHAAVFSLGAIVIGAQWYAFNYYHTGDPIFPLLWGIVDYPLNFPWSDAQSLRIRELYEASETPVQKSIGWFLFYPFAATLDPHPQFESSRVGLGVAWLILLPLAAAGMWHHRRHFLQSPAFVFILICLLYYFVWFFLGPSQRVRHLLPVYPLFLIAFVHLGYLGIRRWPGLVAPCACALIAVILIQAGGHAIFSAKFIKYIVSNQTRSEFLQKNIVGYDVVTALNALLGKKDRVLVTYRQWLFRLNVPYFYAHPDLQSEVSMRLDNNDPALFLHQTRNKAITHIVATPPNTDNPDANPPLQKIIMALHSKACVKMVQRLEVLSWPSRTLQLKPHRVQPFLIYKLTPDTCQLS